MTTPFSACAWTTCPQKPRTTTQSIPRTHPASAMASSLRQKLSLHHRACSDLLAALLKSRTAGVISEHSCVNDAVASVYIRALHCGREARSLRIARGEYRLLGHQGHEDHRTAEPAVPDGNVRYLQPSELRESGADRHQRIVRENHLDAIPDGRLWVVAASAVRAAAAVLGGKFNQLGEGGFATCARFFCATVRGQI